MNKIKLKNLYAFVYCKSEFYRSLDVCKFDEYEFTSGINFLNGEIDSGIWGISYTLSMYKHKPKDIIFYSSPDIIANDTLASLTDITELSCYMDKTYKLFSSKAPVKNLVSAGLKKSGLSYKIEDIQELFHIDSIRFKRPITQVGNEIFRCMAAIGFSYNKQVFCFPWLSKLRFENYHKNMTDVLGILESFGKIIILPVGK